MTSVGDEVATNIFRFAFKEANKTISRDNNVWRNSTVSKFKAFVNTKKGRLIKPFRSKRISARKEEITVDTSLTIDTAPRKQFLFSRDARHLIYMSRVGSAFFGCSLLCLASQTPVDFSNIEVFACRLRVASLSLHAMQTGTKPVAHVHHVGKRVR